MKRKRENSDVVIDSSKPLVDIFFNACSDGDVEVMRKCLEQGLNVDVKNKKGETALHICNNIEIAKILLEYGLDADVEDNYGCTPFSYAVKKDNVELAS